MRRNDLNEFVRMDLGPAVENTTARKDKRVHLAVRLGNGQFQVSVEWSGFDFQPHDSAERGPTRGLRR